MREKEKKRRRHDLDCRVMNASVCDILSVLCVDVSISSLDVLVLLELHTMEPMMLIIKTIASLVTLFVRNRNTAELQEW